MKKLILILLIIFYNVGCRSSEDVTLSARNIVSMPLHKQPDIELLVISDERKGQMWYWNHKNFQMETVKNIPEASLHHVWQLSLSPDDRFLAVLCEGEGHPMVEVFDFNEIISQRDGWEDQRVKPMLSIDPYPGTIWIKQWKTNTVLSVLADVPLERLDKKERRVVPWREPGGESMEFHWDVSIDSIKKE